MMYRVLLPILIATLLLAGCKSDEASGIEGADLPGVSKPAADLVVRGRVSLGASHNAVVSVYPILDGYIDRQQPIGTAITDDSGYFSADVSRKYSREPALIEVSLAQADQRCIVLAGCGDGVRFADLLPADRGPLILRLMVPYLLGSLDYQVSLLSEFATAAALAEFAVVSAGSINGVGNLESQFLISKANTQVASRFGIVADLPGSSLIDLTQVDEVLSAAPSTLFNTSIESALLAECLAQMQGVSIIAEALNVCSEQYVLRGIPGQSMGLDDVAMLGVLDGVIDVLSHLQQSGRDLTVEISEVLAQRGVVLSQEPGEYSRGTASDNINLPLIDKGKYFVENVRQVASSLDLAKIVALSNLSGFVGGEAAIALEDFGVNVDASQLLKGDKPGRALSALKSVLLKSADVIGAQFGVETDFVGDEITVQYEQVADEHHMYFDQYVNTCDSGARDCSAYIDLKIVVGLDSLGGNAAVNILNIRNLRFRIHGTISQEGYELSFNSGSDSTVNFLEIRQGSGAEEGLTLVETEEAKLVLPFDIWSYDSDLSHLFNGELSIDVVHLLATYRSSDEEFVSEGALHKNSKTRADLYSLAGLNANLSGKITTESGDVFYAATNVLQAKEPFEGLLEYTSITNEQCDFQQECVETGSETTFVGETDEHFVGLTASVSYKANLQGVREPVQLQISGSRKSPEQTAINSLKVTYPGHALSLSGQFNNSGGITTMDATNLDGMRMYIHSDAGKRHGAVTGPGGEPVGVIEDGGDWVKIRFTDGYFVSM